MTEFPISPDLIRNLAKTLGIPAPGSSSIREIVHLTDELEVLTGMKYIRMEMGVPGLPSPSIGTEAEIAALKEGVAAVYPDISGIASLKQESSRFIKLFLNIDLEPRGCIPTVGSMMGGMVSSLWLTGMTEVRRGLFLLIPVSLCRSNR
jgi:aspartate/methionine/tyrosine aminotransferase